MMEEFWQLSIEGAGGDEPENNFNEDTITNIDLAAISKLTISDSTTMTSASHSYVDKLPEDMRNKIMPHFPTCPSPLRYSVTAVNVGDEMDIDSDSSNADDSEKNDSQLDEIEEIVPDDEPDVQVEDVDLGANSRSMIKALFSPTKLGVAAATREMDKSREIKNAVEDNSSKVITFLPSLSSSADLRISATDKALGQEGDYEVLKNRFNDRPVQVQVNNHHYYYSQPPDLDPSYALGAAANKYNLPMPWSPKANPVSKHSYALTTYLQLVLNTSAVVLLTSIILSLFKAFKTDIQSSWSYAEGELAFESRHCRQQYETNLCHPSSRVPALEQKCMEWEKCMLRNNDVYFRTRSTLSARLIGDVINSLIEPLGWKALAAIFFGLLMWFFSSNFILGFARARSYYGSPNPTTQVQPEILRLEENCSNEKESNSTNSS
ncbi:HBR308Cp [Eremothecium sinecaudum]|uniref:HBR308Cp n=1 Tax=Eremothecium sinecaudum TaxID=45286 RepID=A0A109UXA4_9SACH|nr:HBR308Cp [Eremothecium sinecaudum]AMD19209.1 HBR308Cp [Eremothecium sinecaudum]